MKDFLKFTLATVTGIVISSVVLHQYSRSFQYGFILGIGNAST